MKFVIACDAMADGTCDAFAKPNSNGSYDWVTVDQLVLGESAFENFDDAVDYAKAVFEKTHIQYCETSILDADADFECVWDTMSYEEDGGVLKREAKYAVSYESDPEIYSCSFAQWDAKHDVGYDWFSFEELIEDVSVFDKKEDAIDFAREVLSEVFFDELFIIAVDSTESFMSVWSVERED